MFRTGQGRVLTRFSCARGKPYGDLKTEFRLPLPLTTYCYAPIAQLSALCTQTGKKKPVRSREEWTG